MIKQIQVNGAELSVMDVGTGPVLLLVHGFPLDHTMWQSQIEFFQGTIRVLAPDLRGFGKSTGTGAIHHMHEFADDLSALLTALNISGPVTLCGLSMGGYIAFEFALRHSKKLNGLILCDTKATVDSDPVKQNRRDTAARVLSEGPDFLAEAMPEKLFSPYSFSNNPDLIRQTQTVIRNTQSTSIAAASLGMAERSDMTLQIQNIPVKTLVIVGEDDVITTIADMKFIAESLPNGSLSIIPQAGHMSPLENPGAVNPIIQDFLKHI